MKYCSNCGNTADDNAGFCSVCGTAFEDPRPSSQVSRETDRFSETSEPAPIPVEVTPPPSQAVPATVITQTIPQPVATLPQKEKRKAVVEAALNVY